MRGALEMQGEVGDGILFEYRDVFQEWVRDVRELYKRARAASPERWTGATRNWTPVGLVTLNPERVPTNISAPTPRQQS